MRNTERNRTSCWLHHFSNRWAMWKRNSRGCQWAWPQNGGEDTWSDSLELPMRDSLPRQFWAESRLRQCAPKADRPRKTAENHVNIQIHGFYCRDYDLVGWTWGLVTSIFNKHPGARKSTELCHLCNCPSLSVRLCRVMLWWTQPSPVNTLQWKESHSIVSDSLQPLLSI